MPGCSEHTGSAAPRTRRITTDSGPWPLHAAAAARALEGAALAAHEPHALMERAGLAVAKLARALAPAARIVEVWCGPGNNGGDGFVAARWLHRSGTTVRVLELGDPSRQPADAAHARQLALDAGVPIEPASSRGRAMANDGTAGLVIDALLGLGTARAPQGEFAQAIEAINARGAPVLAVDVPSGLHPDTGQPLGEAVVQATHTLALLTLKPSLFTARGRDLAGDVWFDDLGHGVALPAMPSSAHRAGATLAPGDASAAPTAILAGPSQRTGWPHSAHKGRRGDAWIVGGAPGMTGAAWLAARGAST